MPSIDENRNLWGRQYSWPEGGDEWSSAWGGPVAQWSRVLLPRIQSCLGVETILEIAPGYGRWTRFLKDHCSRLLLVDLSAKCIEKCKERFAEDSHISYFVNDGTSLAMIEDRTVDFAFSFDSLVHAEPGVLKSYVSELARVLKPVGAAFIHHSNLLACASGEPSTAPQRRGLRSRRMSAELFRSFCETAGLFCVRQELVNWLNVGALVDCFSTVLAQEPATKVECEVIENMNFMAETSAT